VAIEALTEREHARVRKRITQLVEDGKDLHSAARIALVEIGVHYWVKATLVGVIRSAGGRQNTRAMRSFERALAEANKLADPIRKALAEVGLESIDELKHIVTIYRQAERHHPEDRLEAAAMIIDDAMKSDPEARGRFGRRWGFSMGDPSA
jgi:hypothetical protein